MSGFPAQHPLPPPPIREIIVMHKTTFVMHENRSEDVHKQPHSDPDVICHMTTSSKMNLQSVENQFFSDVTALYVTSRFRHRLNLASPRAGQLSCILQAKKIHHIEYNFKIYAPYLPANRFSGIFLQFRASHLVPLYISIKNTNSFLCVLGAEGSRILVLSFTICDWIQIGNLCKYLQKAPLWC